MSQNTRIAPALKAYMNKALPASQGRHVLALGELHDQTANKDFLAEHITELSDVHNVGLIALETSAFMNVFLWAYKDGKLKQPEGMDAETYLRDMFQFCTYSHFADNAVSLANLAMKAINEGKTLEVGCFDARDTLDEYLKHYENEIQELEATLLSNFYPNDSSKINIKAAFLLREVQKLLTENPEYQTRLDHLEAVIIAQRQWNAQQTWHSTEDKTISNDALSAALVKAMLPKDAQYNPRNAITVSGLNHVTGISSAAYKYEGTFAQHLESNHSGTDANHFLNGLQVTTALAGSSAELREVLVDPVRWRYYKDQEHPFHWPDMLDLDKGKVITSGVTQAAPDSVAALFTEERNAYQKNNPHLKDNSYPTAENAWEIDRSSRGIQQCDAVQQALARVHEDYRAMATQDRERREAALSQR